MKRLVAIFILSLFSINAYALTCSDVNALTFTLQMELI